MPNYKLCRLCTSRFIPKADERICSECEKDIVRAVSMPSGESVQVDTEISAEKINESGMGIITNEEGLKSREPKIKPDAPDVAWDQEQPKAEKVAEITIEKLDKAPESKPEEEVVVEEIEVVVVGGSPEEDRKQKDVIDPLE